MKQYQGRTAVITGAASGFGLEVARLAAQRGMNLVLCDVQADAMSRLQAEFGAHPLLLRQVDVAKADQMQALAEAVQARFGAPHFVFNNAGVGSGGLIWENSLSDWEWVLGVNLMGVVHGVRLFTPLMLAAAEADPSFEGHIVNTASMAGMLNPPNMGVYNVSKHAVVSLSETLYQDLSLVTDQVRCSVLCPYFVPTGISQSHRNRTPDHPMGKPSRSQLVSQAMTDKAVSAGKITAADVAAMVFQAMDEDRFYIFSHPQALGGVQTRLEDVMQQRNPTDPFADKPALREQLVTALRKA
ncbi:SDR family oxidoreductase [Pelomonas sp. APW6]|uniref:SDR family oxidoreductase n=1 Tax=Roseateles subflavus TaxID=3053353 RepID=A0ABT7LH01_9BURK|nr:SDR family oxidoreductase [Pelomonas sp. APW6]MDL5032137.1 SDR family oxidoreductase [Pelomonas sp. APW6]